MVIDSICPGKQKICCRSIGEHNNIVSAKHSVFQLFTIFPWGYFFVLYRRRSVRRFVNSSTASAFSMAWNRPHRRNSTKRGEWAVCRRDDDEASDICNYKWRDAMHEWLPIFFLTLLLLLWRWCVQRWMGLWIGDYLNLIFLVRAWCCCTRGTIDDDDGLVGEISQQRRKSSSSSVETTLLMCFGCASRMGAKS